MKKLYLLFAVAVLIVSTLVSVRAHSGDVLTAANGSAPTIDGNIGSAEWADAATYNISSIYTKYIATAYVKEDGSNLYIAVDQADNTPYGQDGIGLYFDVAHNGGSSLQSDDIAFKIYRLSATLYEYDSAFGNWYPKTPTGWSAATTSTASNFQAEFSIPFSKIGVTAGVEKTLGILFYFEEEYPVPTGTNVVWYSWPWGSGSSYNTPSDWANIVIDYTPYTATIWAWENVTGWLAEPIQMDGVPTGYSTPYNFTGLTGTHTFTVPNTDVRGYPFKNWTTGETSTTITVSADGTYTAQYYTLPSVTIWAWENVTGWLAEPITMDGNPTGFSTPYSFTGLTGTHTFTVPNTDVHGNLFENWTTGETNPTITVSSNGTYTAQYYATYSIPEFPTAVILLLAAAGLSLMALELKKTLKPR